MEDQVIKNTVHDYFAGRATPLQKKVIEDWLKDADNHEQYYQWLHEWELNHLQGRASWEDAFQRTQQMLHQEPEPEATLQTEHTPVRWWNRTPVRLIAAVLVVAFLGVSFPAVRNLIYYQTSETGYGETRKISFEDGSSVTLNANSSLRYPRFGFGEGTRRVELRGEADFQIEHTPQHQPFIVSIPSGLEVNVLGTQFTVFARSRRSQVTLRSGKVALQMKQAPQASPLVMKPGDLVVVNPSGKLSRSHTAHPEQYASWKDHHLTLNRTSLRELASILEETYGFEVEINDPELASRTATGLLPAENPEATLELIAELFAINFTRHDNRIVFKD